MAQKKGAPGPRNQPQFQGWEPSSWRIWVLMAAVLVFFGWSLFMGSPETARIDYTTFLRQVRDGNVERVEIEGQRVDGTFREETTVPGQGGQQPGVNLFGSAEPDSEQQEEQNGQQQSEEQGGKTGGEGTEGPEYKRFLTYIPTFADKDLMRLLQENDVQVRIEPESDGSFWYVLFMLLPFFLFIWLIYAQYKRFQGQSGDGGIFSIGKSRAKMYRRSDEATSFDDVAGAEGAKTELMEIVSYLKQPERVRKLGAEVPKGVMLVGPPGTGKTLLARAVAGEADVPFFLITGSDFMEMFVGIGAKRVRNLFEDAKKNAPSIIFIDEIDAIGRRRGAGLGGGHDEREQTLNQLLSELDGFEPAEDVIVMTATNRPDVLDPALMRPGRFDRQIIVNLPTTSDRRKILEIYTRNKKISDDVDFDAVARSTPGFSGADLKNMLNEAALLAARKSKEIIDNKDVEDARDKILMGLERQGLTMTDQEKRMVAYHEAGHAIIGAKLQFADPVHKVSIVPRSRSMGVTQQFPDEEKYIYHKQYLSDRLAVMMGGRAAEMLVFQTSTSGAGNDLQQATKTARKMVLEWGMSGRFQHMALGSPGENVFLGEELAKKREYSESTAHEVDREIEALLSEAFSRAEKILKENREAMDRLVDELMEKEEILGDEVYRLLGEDRHHASILPEEGDGKKPMG